MERQRLAQALVLDEAAHRAVDGAVGAQPRELRRDAHHVGEAQEGGVDELLVAGLEDPPAVVHEALEAVAVAGRERGDPRRASSSACRRSRSASPSGHSSR